MKAWQENEILFLKKNYPSKGAKYCTEHLNRTYLGVQRKARELKIYFKRKNIWTEDQVKTLSSCYPKYGRDYCAKVLKRSESSIKKKVAELRLTLDNEKYEKEFFTKAVQSAKSYTEVVRNLGLKNTTYGNRQTVKKYIKLYGIDISHFDYGLSTQKKKGKKLTLEEILVENSPYTDTTNLKYKLYDAGLKLRKCEECGQRETWRGKKLSLILDHKNGINDDNRIKNLRILCPNCDATQETFCRGNKSVKLKMFNERVKQDKKIKKDRCGCGELKEIKADFCRSCYDEARNIKSNRHLMSC